MSKKSQKSDQWIRILKNKPGCMYYFGAFNSYSEAKTSKNGYIQDLKKKGAEIVNYKIEQGKPEQLTMDLK